MPYMQMQLAAETFFALFREGLEGQMVSAIDEHPIENIATLLIDRVEVLPTTTIDDSATKEVSVWWGDYKEDPHETFVPAKNYVLVQPLMLHPVLLVGDGTSAPQLQPQSPVSATFRVKVSAWSAADNTVPVPNPLPEGWLPPQWVPHLFLEPVSLEIDEPPSIPGVPPALVTAMLEAVEQQIKSKFQSSGKKLTTKTPFGTTDFVNTGLAFNAQKTRLSILMQSPPSLEARVWVWQNLFNEQLDDLLQSGTTTHHWAQATDSVFPVQATATQIERGLKKKAGEGKLKFKQFPQVTWSTPNDMAHLSVYVPVEQYAPDPLAGTIDVDIHADLSYSVQPPGTMKMDADLRAVITGASFNLVLLASVGALLGLVILGGLATILAGPFAAVVVAIVASTLLGLLNTIKGPSIAPDELGDFVCNEGPVVTDSYGTRFTQHVTCTRPSNEKFSLDGGREAQLILNDARGLPSGFATHQSALVTRGAVLMPPAQTWGLTVEVIAPVWEEPRFSCGSSFMTLLAMHSAGQIRARARGSILVTPLNIHSPVTVISATLRSPDPLNVRHEITIEHWGYSSAVNLYMHWNEAYQNAPYPFWLLLRTTKGFRLVKIDPPPAMTKKQMEDISLGGILGSMSRCNTRSAPFFADFRGMNIKWIPDPPPDTYGIEQLWEIKVRGLQPGDGVQITDPAQRTLGEFSATARGEAVFSTVVKPDRGASVTLQRLRSSHGRMATASANEADAHGALRSDQHVAVTQTVIVKRAHVNTEGRVTHWLLDVIANRPSVLATSAGQLTVVDVTTPASPAVRALVHANGLRGALALGNAVLLYGEFGIVKSPWREHAIVVPRTRGCGCGPADDAGARWWAERPVRKVARGASHIYVLTDEGITAYTSLGQRTGIEIGGSFDDVEVVGGHLYALIGGAVRVYELADRHAGNAIGEFAEADGVSLFVPTLGLSGYLYVRCTRGGRLLDVGRPDQIETASLHDEDPFWTRASQWLTTIVAIDRTGGIDIYSTEATADG